MKTAAILILGSLVLSSANAAFAAEFLTAKQQQDVLNTLDDNAGDSWDEGDFEFKFDAIHCSDSTDACVVLYRDRYQASDKYGADDPRDLKAHPYGKTHRCEIAGVKDYAQVLDKAYESMDACASKQGH